MEGSAQRHDRSLHCPICGGHSGLQPGRGIRCVGFSLDRVVYCTREEFAGRLPLSVATNPPSFMHRRTGECGCGVSHGAEVTRSRKTSGSVVRVSRSVPVERRDQVYRALLEILDGLRPEARADLLGRGLTEEQIEHGRFRSIPVNLGARKEFLRLLRERCGDLLLRGVPGLWDKNDRPYFWYASRLESDGYVVPYIDEQDRVTGIQLKVLGGKYLTARGTTSGEMYHVGGPRGSGDLFVTEGGLKAEVAASLGGVWCLGVPGQALSDAHLAAIQRLAPKRVIVALDEEDNPQTDKARERWLEKIFDAGLTTARATWKAA